MSKFVPIIIGGGEILAGVALEIIAPGNPAGIYLIAAGAGELIGGLGTLLNSPQGGLTTASRNPIAPWNIVYGRAKVGGTIVYINESGESDKYLDLIFVLAAHPCESVDALLFDNQRVLIGANGNSFSPTQQTVNISEIIRSNGVVTVTLSASITDLEDGDLVQIKNVTGDESLNGKFYISKTSGTSFTYISGGMDADVVSAGQVETTFPDYRGKVHMEVLLGDQTATFPGMIDGTPYDDSDSDIVTVDNNPWTADHLLSGKTAVFLRLHYNDEVFASGLPQISFRLHGKNDIADVRTSPATVGYTENPALCIADYLKNQVYGFKASSDEVPDADVSTAANICDEDVSVATGTTEPRYTLNGNFPLSMKRGEVLQNMLTSCGGRVTYNAGQFVIHPAAWVGPSGVQIGTDLPPISAATLTVVSSFVNATLDTPAKAHILVNDIVVVATTTPYSSETDTHVFSTTGISPEIDALNADHSIKLDFFIDAPIGTVISASPASILIYDCYVDVTYADATTGRLRPQLTSMDNQGGSGFGAITDAKNAIDGDPDTNATLTRVDYDSLDFYNTFRLSGFPLGGAGTIDTGGLVNAPSTALMAGPFRWKQKVSIRDLYNGVKGTYVSPANGWQMSDYPPYAQDALHGYEAAVSPQDPEGDANMAADGGERRWLDMQLPFTISPSTAQRLAKIELLRRRQQGTGTFAFNMAMYQLTALDVVSFTLPYLGWNNKLLEVGAHRLTVNKQQSGDVDVTVLGCELDLQETDPSVYEWATSEELTPQGFQQSGIPSVANPKPPTAVTLTSDATTSIIGADGIARSRILVQWVAPADGYVTQGGHIEIQYQLSASPTSPWISIANVDPTITQAYIDGVTDGTAYIVQVRSVNAAGVPSVWVQAGPITVSGASSSIDPGIINQDGATDGQGLVWNGTTWVPTALAVPIELQTDGVDNGSQTKLNLAGGDNITLSDGGTGTVTIASSGSGLVIGYAINDGSAGTSIAPVAIAPRSGSFGKCKIVTKASDASTDLTFTINQNGTSVFSSDPTISAGTASGTLTTNTGLTSSPLTVAADDLFTIDISSGSSSWKFTAQLET